MAKIKEPKMAKPLNVKPVFRVPFSATTIPTKSQSPGSIYSFHHLSSPNIIPQNHLCSLCKRGPLTCSRAEGRLGHTLTVYFCFRTRKKTPHAPSKVRRVLYSTKPQRSRFSWCHHSILIDQHITSNNNVLMLFPGHPITWVCQGLATLHFHRICDQLTC